jgi:L-fuconolactonase
MNHTCIDAHHHLWSYKPPGYSWMTDEMASLRRDFDTVALRAEASRCGITGTIVVEVARTNEETLWLSEIAAKEDFIQGIVGWAALSHPKVSSELERLSELPKLKGLRYPIHDEPNDDFMLREEFDRGIKALKQFNFSFDLLVFARHLPQTIDLVDKHPHQVFILDHIAKPLIRRRLLSPWKENIAQLALRPNVYCKLSGVLTEADWQTWTDDDIAPYMEIVLNAFGPKRLMFGSDWPLVTLASSYEGWLQFVRRYVKRLSEVEQEWIFFKAATEAYRLNQCV